MIITEGQLKEIHLQSYQCVVVYLDSEFNWTKKTEDVFKQAQSRFFLRTIRSLGGKTSENQFQTTYLLGIPNLTNASAVKPRYICFPYLLLNEKKLYKRGFGGFSGDKQQKKPAGAEQNSCTNSTERSAEAANLVKTETLCLLPDEAAER